MAAKILVNYHGSLSNESLEVKRQEIADKLCVCCEDVIFIPGVAVSVVDLPDELTKAREKADKDAAAAAEKARKDQEKAELDAIKASTPAPVQVDYETWTLEDLHAEASKRDLQGRSGLNKSELAKALHKDDKGK